MFEWIVCQRYRLVVSIKHFLFKRNKRVRKM